MIATRDLQAARTLLEDLRARGDEHDAEVVERLIAAAQEQNAAPAILHPPELLTTGQAARALGVSVQTIKNWAGAGKLKTIRLGGRTMVVRESLLAYLDGLRAEQAASPPRRRTESPDETARRTFIQMGFPQTMLDRLRELVEAMEERMLTPAEAAELDRLEAESARISAERLRQWIQGNHVTTSTP